MKVAIVSNLYAPNAFGGAERVAQSVAEGLAGEGHEIHVVSLGRVQRVESASLNGVTVHYCPLRNFYWPFPVSPAGQAMKVAWHALDAYNPAMGRGVGALLDEIRPDVVNTHNIAGFSAAAWTAVARRGLPLVHTLHDHYLLCPYSTMFRSGRNCSAPCLRCRIATLPRRAIADSVDSVIGVSRYILDRHLAYGLFAGARAAVVYSGYRRPGPPQGVPERPAGEPLRFGFLGGLHPIKGLDRMLDAFLDLPPRAAELWIAGAGNPDYEAAQKRRTVARDDVRWLGVALTEEFLSEIDLLVVPSPVHEAMPRVVFEAFAHGIPVIGARRGGIPEPLGAGCGWLFDPDDAAELPALLRQVLEHRATLAAMRPALQAQALRFSNEAMVAGYLAAYQDAVARRKR